jgi:hypothetical protein
MMATSLVPTPLGGVYVAGIRCYLNQRAEDEKTKHKHPKRKHVGINERDSLMNQ